MKFPGDEDDWYKFLKDIVNEVELHKKLKHENVIKMEDVLIDKNEKVNIIMEYAEGGTLQDAIDESPLETERIIEVIEQTCLGLKYMHDNGVLHRDLKPANILLTTDG